MSQINLILNKSDIEGTVEVPPSKSFTHRAIICAALAQGTSKIYNPLICEDTIATIEAFKILGAKIEFRDGFIEVKGVGNNINTKKPSSCTLNCRQSGSTMRFIIPIASLLCDSAKITGDEGLLKRPVFHVVDVLKQMNANITSNGKLPPVEIKKSTLKPSVIEIAGNVSSQYITGLLFILPLLEKQSKIIITTEMESKNYILITLDILRKFGIKIKASEDLREYIIEGNQKYTPTDKYIVEGDCSSSAFLFASGVLASPKGLTIKGINYPSLQGDGRITDILKQMGADLSFSQNEFSVKKSKLKAIKIDAKDIPDMVPTLAVIASQAHGKTIIENIERLRIKESDRAAAITSQLKKMGADIVENKNSLEITGPTTLRGAEIDSHNDHRIAMACSIAGFIAEGDTIIQNPICIKKSYPVFYDDMRKLGANIMPLCAPLGKKIKLSIYGDSHGRKIGFLLEGIPKNIKIADEDIQKEVDKRRSISHLSTARTEEDKIHVISGIKDESTTGDAIKIEIFNKNVHSGSYESIKHTPRPGHADFTAREKYASIFDYNGGGFASGRLTACLVAAGAVAKKILNNKGIQICAYTKQIGDVILDEQPNFEEIQKNTYSNLVRCPDQTIAKKMTEKIEETKNNNDSVGGIVECIISGLPVGLGEPLFDSVESIISHAIFSIPAVKAIEFGSGFNAATLQGSKHNDEFYFDKDNTIHTYTNNAGGILGGITNSMPVVFRVAIKPTASISKEQRTVNLSTYQNTKITVGGRHDPCIAIRVPPIAEAMAAISILDLYLEEKD
ncbi:MAG: 3-phosphoshikimate 1-carboxyvinyltransferase [Candidatus Aenigmarchaeota archaeon]|nr:3-phosphoshikimate 1-carboxyvinyltransferase [Candidatus Aenigmarchaeota archaeon]